MLMPNLYLTLYIFTITLSESNAMLSHKIGNMSGKTTVYILLLFNSVISFEHVVVFQTLTMQVQNINTLAPTDMNMVAASLVCETIRR